MPDRSQAKKQARDTAPPLGGVKRPPVVTSDRRPDRIGGVRPDATADSKDAAPANDTPVQTPSGGRLHPATGAAGNVAPPPPPPARDRTPGDGDRATGAQRNGDRTTTPAQRPGDDRTSASSAPAADRYAGTAPADRTTSADDSARTPDDGGFDRAARGGDTLLVDDTEAAPAPGKMPKSDFLSLLRADITATASGTLAGTRWSAEDCPWIEHWFGYYAERDAAQVERAMRQYAPETDSAGTAEECIPIVSERVRRAAESWARHGDVSEVPDQLPEDAQWTAERAKKEAAAAALPPRLKPRPGETPRPGGDDPATLRDRLGAGEPLDSAIRAKMEPSLGDLSAVRVHTDPTAADMAAEMGARAFAVGKHVGFAAGEFRPETPVGQALIAHELAHAVQQDDTPGARSVAQETELERDADAAAARTLRRLARGESSSAAGVAEARPRVRSGLTLSRCSSFRGPSYAEIVADADVQARTDAAWASTKAATTPTGRREEGFWIQFNTTSRKYSFAAPFTGPTAGPNDGAAATPTPKPADSGDVYTVALFHTHTPTTHRPVGRPVGPSDADNKFHTGHNVAGVVYDYVESPAGSGSIPAGHPLNSAAQRYHSGPDRRT